MSTATTIAREDQTSSKADNTRRCIVTGEMRPKDELIRFVVAPDQTIVADLAQNLPGRGLWVTAARQAIETAAHKNLFAKAAKMPVKPGPDLAATVARLLKKRCLDHLGLARSAGIAVLGQPQVEAALKSRKLALLLIADDAAAGGFGKINPGSVTMVRSFTRKELGMVLGYEQVVYVGLMPHGLTEKLRRELAQLEKIAGDSHIPNEVEHGNQ